MKVLITGCKGQVGTELMLLAQAYGCEAIGFDRQGFDITDQSVVNEMIACHKPDAVINAAAYTAVDKAESDEEAAFTVNAVAVEYLAQACSSMDVPLVHISTDYVFDGSKVEAYAETDAVAPLGVYGRSKLAGEEAVQKICKKYYILRTSWVFSPYGNNFVKTMLRLGAERETLSVVADQKGKPTSAQEIAKVIYMMLDSQKDAWGVYHCAQPEAVSWYQFAQVIFAEAKKKGMKLKISKLHAIITNDFPTVAKRPQNSALDCVKLEKVFQIKLEPWNKYLCV